MASVDERRAAFKGYKEDVDRRGKPFFPHAMFHDTVMSLVVVCVIVALAVIWKFTADNNFNEQGEGDYTGLLGAVYTNEADPGTTNFVPRPDWYFYFLFYLLRIFKWPESVILGTVGIPTILLVLLLAMPFIDIRRERRISRRPVAVVTAVLVVIAMGVPPTRARRQRRRSRANSRGSRRHGRRSRDSRTTSRRSRARSCSPRPAASPATPISRPGRPTSARPS